MIWLVIALAYFAVGAAVCRFIVPQLSDDAEDAALGGLICGIAWPLALPMALFGELARRSYQRRK